MKSNPALFSISSEIAGRYTLEGELSFASVDLALKRTADFFVTPGRMIFDLAGVAKADSAALALML